MPILQRLHAGRREPVGEVGAGAEVPMTERVSFTVPGRAPAATSPNGRVHYLTRHVEGKAYGEAVYLIASCDYGVERAAWERAVVTLTQRAVRLRDHDNFAASFKPGLDAIVRAGIILDDKPQVIDLVLKAEKVGHQNEEEVLVVIERTDP